MAAMKHGAAAEPWKKTEHNTNAHSLMIAAVMRPRLFWSTAGTDRQGRDGGRLDVRVTITNCPTNWGKNSVVLNKESGSRRTSWRLCTVLGSARMTWRSRPRRRRRSAGEWSPGWAGLGWVTSPASCAKSDYGYINRSRNSVSNSHSRACFYFIFYLFIWNRLIWCWRITPCEC